MESLLQRRRNEPFALLELAISDFLLALSYFQNVIWSPLSGYVGS
jgi:hypothetical protein